MQSTFKNPLKPKRTDFSYHSGIFDYKYIREHAVENPFGIKPDPPETKPCTYTGCQNQWDIQKGLWVGTCKGDCYGY